MTPITPAGKYDFPPLTARLRPRAAALARSFVALVTDLFWPAPRAMAPLLARAGRLPR